MRFYRCCSQPAWLAAGREMPKTESRVRICACCPLVYRRARCRNMKRNETTIIALYAIKIQYAQEASSGQQTPALVADKYNIQRHPPTPFPAATSIHGSTSPRRLPGRHSSCFCFRLQQRQASTLQPCYSSFCCMRLTGRCMATPMAAPMANPPARANGARVPLNAARAAALARPPAALNLST